MKKDFGVIADGTKAFLYTLHNKNGMEVCITDYGAAIVKLLIKDKNGKKRDIVLGYDDVSGYEKGDSCFGGIVGRVAGRIAGGSFALGDNSWSLKKNDGNNTLHGGCNIYNQRMWQVEEYNDKDIRLIMHSPEGDQGFPGNLDVMVEYLLEEDNTLSIDYRYRSDRDTLVNLTNHSYFNLSGHDADRLDGHEIILYADYYTPTDEEAIPTGEIASVAGTKMDFRTKRVFCDEKTEKYNDNWVIRGDGCRAAAECFVSDTGIWMKIFTDLPGMQFYTADYLENEKGKNGIRYHSRSAVCFETQYFPDAVHHESFEVPIAKAGKEYHHIVKYHFKICL